MDTQVINLSRFAGINLSDSPGRIPDQELLECQNFTIGQYGELIKRAGISTFANPGAGADCQIIGYFFTPTYNQLIVRVGNTLYAVSDPTTVVTIGVYNNVEYGVQYNDVFYMVRRDDVMVTWNGTTAATIAGSPFGTTCVVYKDLMFVVNSMSTTLGSTVYYSDPNNAGDFSSARWLGQFFKVSPGDGDFVTAFALIHDVLSVFKQQSMWMLYLTSDVAGWTLRNTSTEIGCISKYSPKDVNGMCYFAGPRGFFRTDGYNFTELSLPVRDIFRLMPVGQVYLNQLTAAYWEDKIIMIVPTTQGLPTWNAFSSVTWDQIGQNTPWSGSGTAYIWLVFHLRTEQWTKWLPAQAAGIRGWNFQEVLGPSTLKLLYIGSRNKNKLYSFIDSRTYQDDAAYNYDCIIETKDTDFENPVVAKRGLWATAEITGSGVVTLYNVPDSAQQAPVALTYPGGRTTRRMPGPGFFRTWRIRMVSTTQYPMTVYSFSLALTARNKMLLVQ